jgi:hypothetical protein
VIQIQSFFQFIPDWYRESDVRRLVAIYYWQLHSILREYPCLSPYLKRCVHCDILFFTDPRNIDRNDLGCPFGCRQSYRKLSAARRVKAYYKSKEGKRKKSRLNNASYQTRCASSKKISHSESVEGQPDKSLIIYIQLLVSIIEGRRVSLAAINSLLKDFRQHSIDIGERIGYRCSDTASRPP